MTKKIDSSYDFLYLKNSGITHLDIKNIKNKPLIIINEVINNEKSTLKVILEKEAKIDILEVFVNKQSSISASERIMNLEEKAQLNYIKLQVLTNDSILTCEFSSLLKEKSLYNNHLIELGSLESLNTMINELNYKEVRLNVNILTKLEGKTKVQNHIRTIHNAPSTYSSITNKHILKDESKSFFDPLSIVNKDALYTQAYQYSKAILLSDACNVKANPHLEILIDELKAGHGSSIGSVDKNALFYLQSKGIKEELAKTMILQAFEKEIYDKISSKKIQDFIKNFSRRDYV